MPIYTNFEEVTPVYRGDDIVIPKPYAGVVAFRDGRYIIASREKGRLVLVDGCDNDLVVCSADPLSLRHNYDKLICYGIALHVGETTLYMLVGEEDSTELYITRIEIIQKDNRTYTFKWHPAFDVRLPSVVAKNVDYDTPYTIQWTERLIDKYEPEDKPTEEESIPTSATPEEQQLLKYDANGVQWLTHLLRYQNEGKLITQWEHLKDELLINLTDFPTLGPILTEYKPCIASVGARVMVGCTNVQLYVACFDMAIWYEDKVDPDKPRNEWMDFLRELIQEQGWELNDEPDPETGLINGPTIDDYFPEGKGKSWWVEPVGKWIDGVYQNYQGSWIHFKVIFQHPFPVSSIVTIYPDLGMIEGISHVGSAIACAMPTEGEIGHPWKGEWSYPLSLEHKHQDLRNFFPNNIIAAEADIDIHWSRNNFIVPSNVLVWPDEEPWSTDGEVVMDAFKEFIKWWVKVYQKQCKIDPIAEVRRLQPPIDDSNIAITHTTEPVICFTHRDSARNAFNISNRYDFSETAYPWSVIEGIQQGFIDICNGRVMVVTPERILRGMCALYKLTTRYNDNVTGTGLDIYMGKVIIGQEKIVEVTFEHYGTRYVRLSDITISIVADADYPYYRFAKLSLDGTTWSDSINYNKTLVHPDFEATLGASSFKFYAKVLCDSTQEDPKPIKVSVLCKRIGS